MHRIENPPLARAHRQRGITLIESMVAIIVAVLGVLGIVGMQMRTLADTQTAVRRAQAVRLIGDLSERMRTSPNGLSDLNNYLSGYDSFPSPGNCASNPCSHTALAQYDLATWKQAVRDSLPLGQANIFLAPGEATNRRLLGVMVSWRENERDTSSAYKNNIDATQVRAADGTLSAGTDANNACPADRTCQLQYLSIPARCAPYASSGSTQFYCPGP